MVSFRNESYLPDSGSDSAFRRLLRGYSLCVCPHPAWKCQAPACAGPDSVMEVRAHTELPSWSFQPWLSKQRHREGTTSGSPTGVLYLKLYLKGPPRRVSHRPSQHCVNIILVSCRVPGLLFAFLRAGWSLATTGTSAALQEELEIFLKLFL